MVVPHPTADVNTVDRFQPVIKVDAFGRVHVIYYDTQHSTNRNGVDLYYQHSLDGAVTWSTPQRVTAVTSPNISDSFEFGDYNGMDMVLDQVIAIYTDNRDEAGGSAQSKDAYAAGGFAPPPGSTCSTTSRACTRAISTFPMCSCSRTRAARRSAPA